MVLLGEVTPRSMDYLLSFGERLSIKIVAHAIADLGKKIYALTGNEAGIITDSNFGESKPLMDTTRLRVSKTLEPLFSKKVYPVIGGFAGADQHGRVTTFGRGGSDYTATTVGSCIKADEIWLMSDVDGLMTADPKLVKESKVLNEVSYVEAIEMALFGANHHLWCWMSFEFSLELFCLTMVQKFVDEFALHQTMPSQLPQHMILR